MSRHEEKRVFAALEALGRHVDEDRPIADADRAVLGVLVDGLREEFAEDKVEATVTSEAVEAVTRASAARPRPARRPAVGWLRLAAAFVLGVGATIGVSTVLGPLAFGPASDLREVAHAELTLDSDSLHYQPGATASRLDGVYLGVVTDVGGERTVEGRLVPCRWDQARGDGFELLHDNERLRFVRNVPLGSQVELWVLGYRASNAGAFGLAQGAGLDAGEAAIWRVLRNTPSPQPGTPSSEPWIEPPALRELEVRTRLVGTIVRGPNGLAWVTLSREEPWRTLPFEATVQASEGTAHVEAQIRIASRR